MKRYKLILLGIVVVAVWILLGGGISLYVDALWFESVGYYGIFRSVIWLKAISWLVGFLISILLLWVNFWLASRRTYEQEIWFRQEYLVLAMDEKKNNLFKAGILVLSALLGLFVQAQWLMFAQFNNQVPGGPADPIFGKSLSFYFFDLPVWDFLTGFALALVFFSLVVAGISYVFHGHLGYSRQLHLSYAARIHLAILVGIGFLIIAVRLYLKRYHLLFSIRDNGVTFGAGYTDVHAWLPVYWILTGLVLVVAVLFFIAPLIGSLKHALAGVGAYILIYLASGIYPAIVQTFRVEPNELEKESTYLSYHLKATLDAYDLQKIEVKEFTTVGRLDAASLAANQGTVHNIRLWDWRPLKDAYGQLQTIRPYYSFEDVDLDRYVIDGNYRQIMLSVRELNFAQVSEQAQTWINQFFQYTHGYGLCASPVNEVTEEGLPDFFIKDIPPRSTVDLQVTRPEIYYGEKTDHPIFVKTRMKEFDYPQGAQNAFTTYAADRGLNIGSFTRKLLFAWELGSFQILFTSNFAPDSRVLLNRSIRDRVRKIAPFFDYDNDPYIAIDQGRLFWIQDAYTTSVRYPYAEPFERQFNYIRNSVKVVIDAYLGDVSFYISDPDDPLILTYQRIFPTLFKPMSELRPGLRSHIRYPEDMFGIQREMYCTYHMRDPRVFYNKEDLWEIPHEIYGDTEQAMESYYTIMGLPGEDKEEFVLLTPFAPKNKNNMIAWMAARSDDVHYGKLLLFQFPKQQLTYGPMQIEARIDQDPTVSQLITLWSQKGSRVIRGNLLVIPIEGSVLYVEPMYLQAEKSEIPELTRVIIVYENRVVIGETLKEALDAAVAAGPQRRAPLLPPPPAPETSLNPELQTLLQDAIRQFDLSQERLKEGDWSGYGEAQRKLKEILDQLRTRTAPEPLPKSSNGTD
ncbi:MAG: UPF0182 family protein [Acidobacteria bacterium]|nr:MAG: UPF0182 family protein [Acidobacteriota bacterium]